MLIDHTSLFKPIRGLSVRERLQPTVDIAKAENAKARLTGYALNIAVGLQLLLGSLTTGLSAVAVASGKQGSSVQSMLISDHLFW